MHAVLHHALITAAVVLSAWFLTLLNSSGEEPCTSALHEDSTLCAVAKRSELGMRRCLRARR